MDPKASKNLRNLRKTCENFEKLGENFEKLRENFEKLREKIYKTFFHGVVFPDRIFVEKILKHTLADALHISKSPSENLKDL